MIDFEEVRLAQQRVAPVIRPTPVRYLDSVSSDVGRPLLFKPEYLQRTGSYKLRGAYNCISQLPPDERVVAASAGNHAQGVALSSALTGHDATVFMPATAPAPKIEATRCYGATVDLTCLTVDECIRKAREQAESGEATFVAPFDDPRVIAGQGTLGLELAHQAADAQTVVVPIGGGGLISGMAVALRNARPRMRIIGVEAAGAPAMRMSLDEGRCVTLETTDTMADGIAVRSVAQITLDHVAELVDDVVTVTEEEISTALVLLLERAKAVVEPAGAVGLAAVLAGKVPGNGPVCVVLSGGNIDPLLLMKVINHGMRSGGRYAEIQARVSDRPIGLVSLIQAVTQLGAHVVEIEQSRSLVDLSLGEVEVRLTLEGASRIDPDDITRQLSAQGFASRHG